MSDDPTSLAGTPGTQAAARPTSPGPAGASNGSEAAGAWTNLDAVAATPQRLRQPTADAGRAATSGAGRLRLRRSRSRVMSALDSGGSVLQGQARDLFIGVSLLLLPVVAVNLWATTQAFDRSGGTTLTAFGGDDVGTGLEDIAAMLAVVFASLAAAVVGLFASIILLADRFGQATTLRPALRVTMRRLPAVLVAWAVGHLWVPFFAIWVLASRSDNTGARVFLVLPFATLFTSITLFAIPAMVAERLGPFAALRRSWRLFKLRSGTAFGFVLSGSLVGSLLILGITAVPSLMQGVGFVTFGDYLWLAQGLTSQLAVIVVVPLIGLATASLYLLVRLDAEGLDITLDAHAAFGGSASSQVASGGVHT